MLRCPQGIVQCLEPIMPRIDKKVPKRYRLTRVEQDRYDLESALPLALELGKITDLGLGLRVESKGWFTGAYRVYRISTEPLGNPKEFEPELIHIPQVNPGSTNNLKITIIRHLMTF